MYTNLTPHLYYQTRLYCAEGAKPCVDPERLAELLPHGSGFNGDLKIEVFKNGNILVSLEYHAMNGDGYYVGWRTIRARIYRAPSDKLIPLRGPLEGKVQALWRKGDILLHVYGGRDDALADYAADVLLDALAPVLTRRDSEIEQAS